MTSFSDDFLDAPLMSETVGRFLHLFRGGSALNQEALRLTDDELVGLGMTRQDLQDMISRHALRSGEQTTAVK